MILCIPVEKNLGSESPVHGHFGSAPSFLLHDTEKGTYEPLENANLHHSHGQCHPMQSLAGRNVGVVLCRGMGRMAVERLNEGGVKVLVGEAATAGQAVEAYNAGRLMELDPADACGGHGHSEKHTNNRCRHGASL